MKIFGKIISTLLSMIFIAFCVVIATFLLAIFIPDGVLRAFEVFKSLA